MEPLIMVLVALAVLGISAIYLNIGIGGGSIYVPLFILLVGLEKNIAVPLSLVLVASGASVAVLNHYRAGMVEVRPAICMGTGAVIGALFGAFFNLHIISVWLFRVLFASLLFAVCGRVAYDLWRNPKEDVSSSYPKGGRRLATAVVISIGIGFLGAAFGIGGGILYIPVMCYLLHMRAKTAAGTSSLAIIFTSVAGSFTYFIGGASILESELPLYILGLVPFCLAGAYVGTSIGVKRLNTPRIRALFLFFTLLVGMIMIADLLI